MRVPVGVVLLLGIALLGGGLAVVALSPTAGAVTTPSDTITAQSVEIVIDSTGDARVILTQSLPAGTDAEQAAFEDLAAEFERGDHEIGGRTIIANIDRVEAQAGREMTIHNQTRTATVEKETGYFRHEFGWTNFGQLEEERIEVGDAFHDETGHWLGTLSADQRLIVTLPEEYRLETDASRIESTTLAEGQIIWEGPIEFAVGDIQLILEPSPTTPDQPVVTPSALLLGLGAGVVLIGALWWLRSRNEEPNLPAEGTPAEDTPASEESGEPDEPVDPELLSDEERVEQMLVDHGGRMKQATIVEETNWSSAKVSQLLSEMEENGRIEKLRIRRENLISLAEENATEP